MKKVLVVDDDAGIRTVAAKRLSAGGLQTTTASDGAEGLDLIRQLRPDVVVLDLMMPKMHGFSVVQAVRSDPKLNGVKIIICSAKTYQADIDRVRQLGADRYLPKPYNLQELWDAVSELLGNGRPPFTVRFWGTRGSIATPGPSTVKYGGNTACTEVRCDGQLLIFDAGTGIRLLGLALLREFHQQPIKGHLFVGHTHWDHIQGFPFFAPAFMFGNEFTIYSLHGAEKPLEKIFRGQMDTDYFPVRLNDLRAKLTFCELESTIHLGEAEVSYVFLNHPGLAVGFRVNFAGRSLVYMSDHEPYGRLASNGGGLNAMDHEVAQFADGADLFICEAQYTEEEYQQKKGWGHSTFMDAVERAAEANVKKLVIFHHDPAHDDAFLDEVLHGCERTIAERKYPFSCSMAQEGSLIEL
jgi:phosphoribosyl 1,2-cyclic phosphodiesterase